MIDKQDATFFSESNGTLADPTMGDRVRYFGEYELLEEIARGYFPFDTNVTDTHRTFETAERSAPSFRRNSFRQIASP